MSDEEKKRAKLWLEKEGPGPPWPHFMTPELRANIRKAPIEIEEEAPKPKPASKPKPESKTEKPPQEEKKKRRFL